MPKKNLHYLWCNLVLSTEKSINILILNIWNSFPELIRSRQLHFFALSPLRNITQALLYLSLNKMASSINIF